MMKKKILAISAILIIVGATGTYALNANTKNNQPYVTTADLDDSEIQGLLYMREEEKLARDVYLTFYEKYNTLAIFDNIAGSEQRHMDAIKNLLEKYGLDDPAEGKEIGEFSNQELQNLYYDIISEGKQSLIDALTVGGKIEEIDIIDLKEYMEQTDNLDIKRVYNNLLEGSKNHLRAFVKELEMNGVTYEPFYLSQEEFDDILEGEAGKYKNKEKNQNQIKQNQDEQPTIRERIRNMFQNILEKCNGIRNLFRNRNGSWKKWKR